MFCALQSFLDKLVFNAMQWKRSEDAHFTNMFPIHFKLWPGTRHTNSQCIMTFEYSTLSESN